mmetsp:Transcript_11337/g.27345  ORF Transcript_11337/g.27345 Transcript_11337/m.27345 type:complete len:106 (+) Transcript_11337:232-549(+)|eukprot:CAMPEP_0168738064 /NCGR_PEP_ID=MMETSP0724-20121128/10732_1 /TAXON_ID=265536 /ORGANISM="Amphiprora sp., Strain CCMP467" /LENGTH=105 /DNA_ID=CAMNT_0008785379 /DNA_START=42 /DNA_END=359 /DNA_ORIENTATION=+
MPAATVSKSSMMDQLSSFHKQEAQRQAERREKMGIVGKKSTTTTTASSTRKISNSERADALRKSRKTANPKTSSQQQQQQQQQQQKSLQAQYDTLVAKSQMKPKH